MAKTLVFLIEGLLLAGSFALYEHYSQQALTTAQYGLLVFDVTLGFAAGAIIARLDPNGRREE